MKIAVLIPVYNAAAYLRECLDSVIAAGERLAAGGKHSLDIICCDDGSGDSSRTILREYAGKYANVRYLSHANRGVVMTRNRLIDAMPSGCEAFAFVDSDDLVAPETYDVLVEAMERTGADIAECGMPGNAVEAERVVDDSTVYILRSTAVGAWINVVNKLYRRSLVGKIRFREGLFFEEDFFFNYEIHAMMRKKVIVPGVYYTYRDNPGSATHALNLTRYFASAKRRIELSLSVFLLEGRISPPYQPEWCAELSKDAYRMCVRKNLRKNRDGVSRRLIFNEAGSFFRRLEEEHGFRMVGLNPVQRLICICAIHRWYALARVLVILT